MRLKLILAVLFLTVASGVYLEDEIDPPSEEKTDKATQKDEIKLEGLNSAEVKELREKAETFAFQAEVDRMMKLIINSLYRNKEIFLRELISNSADALDKIRVLSLTDKSALSATNELIIKIKTDKENNVLEITDTGIGMTKNELVKNLGTIAKSGTSEFLQKVGESQSATELTDMIGQFGVGFYSSFLVADKVVVTSKSNDDKQHIWESDSNSFRVVEDPRGDTLKRGTTISLYLKEEARDFLQEDTLRNLIRKYSQFINFNIYLWTSKTETVEEPVEDEPVEEKTEAADEDAKVEEEKDEKPKTKPVEKTTWDWELMNAVKPIWVRKTAEISEEEYNDFYKSITKDNANPLTRIHFVAEGEVTFKSLLYIPSNQQAESFNRYGTKVDNIKLYVRRVFITDDFQDMMPNFLSFVKGVVDSDDLPLSVSRETLQQHKLLKVIKKKLIRKTLDMIKKIDNAEYDKFWKEYSTNIKLGIVEDPSNRVRLAKLVRFYSSHDTSNYTALSDYVSRMKEKQEYIFYIAGSSLEEVENSPFVERLLKKGYEVLYLTEPVDEYAISALPEFEGKKFQNVAKDGLKLEENTKTKKAQENLNKEFEPLIKYLEDDVLKDKVSKVVLSQRLHTSSCALVASQFGWTGNMERLARSNAHSKMHDTTREYYLSQKKTLELNPRHSLTKELLRRVKADKSDTTARNMATLMLETATLRSGFSLQDTSSYAMEVETLLLKTLGISTDEQVEEEIEYEDEEEEEEDKADPEVSGGDDHDEL